MKNLSILFFVKLVLLINPFANARTCQEARSIYTSKVNYSTGKEICEIPNKLKYDKTRRQTVKDFLNHHCVIMVPGFLYTKERFDYYNPFKLEFWRDIVGWGKKDTPIPFKHHFKQMMGSAVKKQYFEIRDIKTYWTKAADIHTIDQVAKKVLDKMKSLKKDNPKCQNGFLVFGHSKGGATIQQLLNAKTKSDRRWIRDNVVAGAVISPTVNGSPLADLVLGQAKLAHYPNYRLSRSETKAFRIFSKLKKKAARTKDTKLNQSIGQIEAAIKATKKGLKKGNTLKDAFGSITTNQAASRNFRNSQYYQVFSARNSPVANVTLSTTNPLENSSFLDQYSNGLNDRLTRLVDQLEKRNKVFKDTDHICDMGHRANHYGKQCTEGLMFHSVEAAIEASGIDPSELSSDFQIEFRRFQGGRR